MPLSVEFATSIFEKHRKKYEKEFGGEIKLEVRCAGAVAYESEEPLYVTLSAKDRTRVNCSLSWFPNCCGYALATGWSWLTGPYGSAPLARVSETFVSDLVKACKHRGIVIVGAGVSATALKFLEERGWEMLDKGRNPYHGDWGSVLTLMMKTLNKEK